ncbi:MAG: Asp-tRNA(Asn)/Glu-tRNA(Gln) amidotransferase subunit GatC [Verrucomicrobiales bacterium]|nr:Asp-tRNA(Asn)/Glu-tRNA(Gln) amidotransferase subunit GatC [Verrucomicrobiales bacterium]
MRGRAGWPRWARGETDSDGAPRAPTPFAKSKWTIGRPFPSLPAVATGSFDIHYVADLARIALTPEEEQRLGEQLGNILGYVEQLRKIDVSGVEPMSHAFPLTNVARPDERRPGLSQEEALRNAPLRSNGLFIVPKIVE